MPEISLPLLKGNKRSPVNADYLDLLPVNILPVFRELEGEQGYLRFFPGIKKRLDTVGVSRGVEYNTVKSDAYRVAGSKLYVGETPVGDVIGSGRVSMAHSRTSQAVSAGGVLTMFRYDGEVKTLENWPASETFPGYTKTVGQGIHNTVGDTLLITASNELGTLSVTITPKTKTGKVGAAITIDQTTWATPTSQSKPATGTPYIKNVQVTGIKFAGGTLTLTYDFIPNQDTVTNPYNPTANNDQKAAILKSLWTKADPSLDEAITALSVVEAWETSPWTDTAAALVAEYDKINPAQPTAATLIALINNNRAPDNNADASQLKWVQVVPDTVVPNPQYDWGYVGDVCRIRGRYVFAQKGTDTFWLTSIEDEAKIDKIAPAYRAENMPDGIYAVREWRDYIVAFGSSTIEFFRLTGDANNLVQFQPSYMVPIGIAGQFAITNYMETFAFITSPSRGQVVIATMGQGTYQQISTHYINQLLTKYTAEQLDDAVLEQLQFDQHMLLICHLPDMTLVYDAVGQAWSVIKTGLFDGVHRAIDYCNTGDKITCGDKFGSFVGEIDNTTSSQYEEDQEIVLNTPIITSPSSLAFDLEIISSSGLASYATRLLVSTTEDGVNYGNETPVVIDSNLGWLSRSIIRRLGRIRHRIGFRLRVVGATPVTLSKLKMRLE